jgi:3-deoxy-manno-octulosonate cytidylyltransferase (CMP-KDO synthetase)
MSMTQVPPFKVVIPARYASTRLPGKPLVDIAGKPMIQHVYERARESGAEEVIIATDDERVARAARAADALVCMTSPEHSSGTERVEEVVGALGAPDDAIVVNVQGDEPMLPAGLIDQVAANLAANESADMATLAEPLADEAQMHDPSVVKVVFDNDGFALYFSRAPIPWCRDETDAPSGAASHHRHVGIYAYRAGFLHRNARRARCELERVEQLEQLRAIYTGARIHVQVVDCDTGPKVDTPEDLAQVRDLFARGAQP